MSVVEREDIVGGVCGLLSAAAAYPAFMCISEGNGGKGLLTGAFAAVAGLIGLKTEWRTYGLGMFAGVAGWLAMAGGGHGNYTPSAAPTAPAAQTAPAQSATGGGDPPLCSYMDVDVTSDINGKAVVWRPENCRAGLKIKKPSTP
jgi:hypothetical protein